MRRWAICLAISVILMAAGLWWLLQPAEVIEIQSRILPIGWKRCFVTDLDCDGNDELVVETGTSGWFAKPGTKAVAITMENGQFILSPVPLLHDLRASEPKGRWLVGKTDSGDIAVLEMLPNGEWQSQVLMTKEGFGYDQPSYQIGDLDGNGLDDDVIVQLGSRGERVFWFKRHPDGTWRKESEINLPTSSMPVRYFARGFYMARFTLLAQVGTSSLFLHLFVWDGQLHVGEMDERVYIFEGDWTNDGRTEKLLVRFLKGDEKVRWEIASKTHSQCRRGEFVFKGWQVMNAAATNKLGDGKWHLLLAMEKLNPITIRVVDCQFEPSKGWRTVELFKRKAKVPKTPRHKPPTPQPLFLHIGDTDGDGQSEVEVAFGQWIQNWLLYKVGTQWKAKSLTFTKGQTTILFFPLLHSTEKMWFERHILRTSKSLVASLYPVAELGTFDGQRKWKPMTTYGGAYSWFIPQLRDLNDDGIPEFLTFEGLVWLRPVLYYRSRKGDWRKTNLRGRTVTRFLDVLLRGSDQGVDVENKTPYLVRWDGKKWFVIVWNDGFVQVVTLRH